MLKPPLPEEYKFGTYGSIDMKACTARIKLLKYIESGGRVRCTVECEIHDVLNNYDGVGQEFIIDIKKVKIK